jgi:predicted AAA+ superfamily ATPase
VHLVIKRSVHRRITYPAEREEREFGALEKIKDNYPKYLLTTDSFTQTRGGIIHLNVFNWLLGSV